MEDDTKAAPSDPKIPETLPINELRDFDYTSSLSEFPRTTREMSKRFNGLENASPWKKGFHSSFENLGARDVASHRLTRKSIANNILEPF